WRPAARAAVARASVTVRAASRARVRIVPPPDYGRSRPIRCAAGEVGLRVTAAEAPSPASRARQHDTREALRTEQAGSLGICGPGELQLALARHIALFPM